MPSPVFTPDLKASPWIEVAKAIRAQGERVTPLGLGYQAGCMGLQVSNPYWLPASRAGFYSGYRQGIEYLASSKPDQICANTTHNLLK